MILSSILFLLIPSSYQQSFYRFDTSECIGIYSESSLVPGKQSFIDISILPTTVAGSVAAAVFAFQDRYLIRAMETIPDFLICSADDVTLGLCAASELGKFHVRTTSTQPILNEALLWGPSSNLSTPSTSGSVTISNGAFKIRYSVAATGFYCIFLGSEVSEEKADFTSTISVNNPYGKLPAIFYPALPFFLALSIVYTILAVAWLTVSFWYWKDLLPIQHYITGVIAFLIVEMAFNFGFFDNYNLNGVISHAMLAFVVILNAARNSISFFMILIVSLGYGVVKPTLGNTMTGCLMLASTHFVFGVLYGTGTMLTNDVNSSLVLFMAIPLSLSMTLFYMWTISALTATIQHLETRRQGVKLLMYKRLYWVLCGSVVLLFMIFFVNFYNLSNRNDPDWIANQWKWRWMLLDGSLNILYLLIFTSIAFLWMPTSNNDRYGLDQIPSEDEDDYEAQVVHGDDGEEGVKLRVINSKGTQEADLETGDDILAWAEEEFDKFDDEEESELTPSNSNDKL